RYPMFAGFKIDCQLGTGPAEAEYHPQQLLSLRRAWISNAMRQRQGRTRIGKEIEELTPIDGHIREHFVADPRPQGRVRRGPCLLAQRRHDFAQRLGHMQVNMPNFLIAPRGDLPDWLIKALRIPPGLRVE